MFKIIHGDCLEVMRSMRDASIDLIVADPPYGQTSLKWDRRVPGWPAAVRRVLKPSGSMWVFGSLRLFMETVGDFKGWKLSHEVIWEKHNGAGFFNDRFRNVHESIAHFYQDDAAWSGVFKQTQFTMDATARTVRKKAKPAHWKGATGPTYYESYDGGPRMMRSVIYCRSEHGRAEHPTQKPEDLLRPLISYACPEKGIVLDPFCGSGTTGVAAKLLNRHFIGIDSNQEYVAIAERRIRDAK